MEKASVKSYKKFPKVIETKEDLYALMVYVAQVFRKHSYSERMAAKGITYLDLANDLFLLFLEGNLSPKSRRPFVNGKATKPSKALELPIDKFEAYGIIHRDLFNILRSPTREEHSRVTLQVMEE